MSKDIGTVNKVQKGTQTMNYTTFMNTLTSYENRWNNGEASAEFNHEICETIEDVKVAYFNDMLTDYQSDLLIDMLWSLRTKVANCVFTD